jgi:polyphosphate kinase
MTEMEIKRKTIPRDISWLSFNARVLQEAADPTVPLRERIKFLGIFSNNLDEFFRVRVATLKRMTEIKGKARPNMHMELAPEKILEDIQSIVLSQQSEFNRIWEMILEDLKKEKIFLITEKELNPEQKLFVQTFFEEEVRVNTLPLMIEGIQHFPYLRDKSIFMGVVMTKKDSAYHQKYALIEVPTRSVNRFVKLPSPEGEEHIILLEDVIRFSLPSVFSYFGYSEFKAWVFKVTRDAEIDIDNDISTTIIQKLEKGIKNRRKGKPVRFVYDREMDPGLLEYLIRRLNLTRQGNLIPGGRIHNYRHFMDFPDLFTIKSNRRKPFPSAMLFNTPRVTDVILQRDVMLHFPYNSFNPVIDLLREAAIDPEVTVIKITAYRLAENSKIVNSLINARRNGKQVTVMLELRARFNEEDNLMWKERLEDEGVRVLIGHPDMKVHAKICLIRKRIENRTISYGFISTGNLNEQTAKVYADHCLLTSNRNMMADISRIFAYLEKSKTKEAILRSCQTLIPCPNNLRRELIRLINTEIRMAQKKRKAMITLKMNSLSDEVLIEKLYEAARAGVELRLVVRGIFCMFSESKKFKEPVKAVSIVDEYLEHARVFIFHNDGQEKVYISSADWMVRNLDHRVEITAPVFDEEIKQTLKAIIDIQLADNVKARVLDNQLSNTYARNDGPKVRSQIEIYNYLLSAGSRQLEQPTKEIATVISAVS